jgi:ribosomal protein S20
MANFSTEGWAGPASQHYQNKKEALINIRASEQNENVKSWIDEYVEALNEQIERAKAEEERQEF